MKLTIGMITARREHHFFDWFIDSLKRQLAPSDEIYAMLVDLHQPTTEKLDFYADNGAVIHTEHRPIKPTVWQGPHKLTREDWWSISSSRNVIICLAKTDFVAFLDDRCVLMPGYLNSIREAMEGDYAVAGAYEKRFGMKVENGVITNGGEVTGVDPRNPKGTLRKPVKTFGGCWCGCNYALPLEWCLEINGHDETCDSLGLEDVVFGNMLALNGHVTMFDARMKIVEDRTRDPGENMPKRTDKGVSPNDRSHALLAKIGASKRAIHPLDIRAERDRVLRGEPWTIPTEPKVDFWDGEPLEQMYVR